MSIFQRILVPTDFSPPAQHAVRVAMDLAKEFGATLTVVHVWDVPAYAAASDGIVVVDILTPLEDAARAALDEAMANVRIEHPGAKAVLRRGSAWREILEAIEEGKPDLVVVGTHGRHGVGRLLLGSVAEKIVRHAPVPVLVARAESAPGRK